MTVARVRIGKIRVKTAYLKQVGPAYWLHFHRLIENGKEVEAIFSSTAGIGAPWQMHPHGVYGRSS